MRIIGLFIVAPIWGLISTQLFLQGWLSFINALIYIIGGIRRKIQFSNVAMGMGVGIGQCILFEGLLYLGYFLISDVMSFGYTKSENIVYWVFASLSAVWCLFQFPSKIITTWRHANVKGALEEDMLKKKASKKNMLHQERERHNYLGNVKNNTFHCLDCTHASIIEKANQVWFNSQEEAILRHFNPCQVCHPEKNVWFHDNGAL